MLLFHKKDNQMCWLLRFFFLFLFCGCNECAQNNYMPILDTPSGPVMGTLEVSRFQKPYYSFRGIPYAKPPIGELRFKAPEPPEPWTGVLNATQDGNSCIQKNLLFYANPSVEGSEDCLYLNVYTPKNNYALLPVMVFIHYGGFFAGSSRSTLLGPEYFMDKDVVLVTFNYRLGIFGFYSTLDDEAPGNWGMKDQTFALKWVQKHISSFGGDRNKVTIFGQSAGSASVHHHILSPLSAGLFHGAISQSGTALNLWAKPLNELQAMLFRGMAQVAGCDHTADTKTIVDCMRKVDAHVLANIIEAFKFFYNEPLNVYTFVVEQKTKRNPEPFLADDPLTIIESGEFSKVPWIIGVVKDEGMIRSAPLIRQHKIVESLNEHFDEYLPKMLLLSQSVPEDQVAPFWNNITDKFLGGKHAIDINNGDQIQGLTDIYTDRSFVYGAYQTALFHSYQGHRPIWFYNFNYKGAQSYGNVFAVTNETVKFDWGVSHCDDLLYLFKSPELFDELSENDIRMSRIMIQLWTNFATHRKPTLNKSGQRNWDPLPDIEGKFPIRNSYLHYLNVKGNRNDLVNPIRFEMRNDFYKERMSFWNRLPINEKIEGIE